MVSLSLFSSSCFEIKGLYYVYMPFCGCKNTSFDGQFYRSAQREGLAFLWLIISSCYLCLFIYRFHVHKQGCNSEQLFFSLVNNAFNFCLHLNSHKKKSLFVQCEIDLKIIWLLISLVSLSSFFND